MGDAVQHYDTTRVQVEHEEEKTRKSPPPSGVDFHLNPKIQTGLSPADCAPLTAVSPLSAQQPSHPAAKRRRTSGAIFLLPCPRSMCETPAFRERRLGRGKRWSRRSTTGVCEQALQQHYMSENTSSRLSCFVKGVPSNGL